MNRFNENQKKAVEHVSGPCLVLAGPGSGKTFVLTNRVYSLIVNENINPENILVITFTRAAANEMKERFIKILDENDIYVKTMPTFGTFHSVFFEILKESFSYNQNSLMTSADEMKIMSEVLEKSKDISLNSDNLSNVIKDIKAYKTSLEKGTNYKPKYISGRLFNKIYQNYQEKLFNEKKLDFHDMIAMCYLLLSKHKEELSYYKEKYKYILVDEFQDINKEQYDLVKLICKTDNLFVVGDDDQSIYKFRGSRPRVMRDFLNDYKKAVTINLNENYRCAKKIVKFSKLVIDNNKDRFDKKLVSKRDEIGNLEIKAFVDTETENKYIIDKIRYYQNTGIKLSEMAILYRTNLLANTIVSALKKQNIDFIMKGAEKKIFDNFAVKDIIAYLKLSINNEDGESLLLIANKPLRYISRDSIGYKKTSIESIIKYYQNKEFVLKYITKFRHNLNTIKKSITALAIRYIRSEVGYDEYLKEYCIKNSIDYDEIEEIVNAFEESAIGHNDIEEFLNYIERDNATEKDNAIVDTDSLKLMTFHLSKGLEFKTVFIIDANDGLIPHKKSLQENDIETERRLFYVAMTRAKDNLHIFFTTRRFGKNFNASRFILEAVGGQDGK